jgi:uncharacterized membrane protein
MSFLVGGAMHAWWVVSPAMAAALPAGDRAKIGDQMAERIRGWMIAAVLALVMSGLYNLLMKANLPPGYHMWFGIKMLFALHIIAVGLLLGRAGVAPEKRSRWVSGIAVSGLIVLALSAYLRGLQQ